MTRLLLITDDSHQAPALQAALSSAADFQIHCRSTAAEARGPLAAGAFEACLLFARDAATDLLGETATIRGEVVADDIVVNGRVIGRVRGLKVRLTSTARVEGDIIHKTIAIESGAHFEGTVTRQDDPLSGAKGPSNTPAAE